VPLQLSCSLTKHAAVQAVMACEGTGGSRRMQLSHRAAPAVQYEWTTECHIRNYEEGESCQPSTGQHTVRLHEGSSVPTCFASLFI
jgi:hypothetical protein